MPLDRAAVRKIAVLARLDVPEAELDGLARELDRILGWVEALGRVETAGVAPMTSVADLSQPRRADRVTDGHCRDAVLANAPEPVDGYFAVPKVVE